MPAQHTVAPRLGDPGRPGAGVEVLQDLAAVVALVGHDLRGRLGRRRQVEGFEVRRRDLEGCLERLRVAGIAEWSGAARIAPLSRSSACSGL